MTGFTKDIADMNHVDKDRLYQAFIDEENQREGAIEITEDMTEDEYRLEEYKPDIVLPKYKTIIFVNGCFWHKHEGCRYFAWPQNNAEFWKEKIESNVVRDKKQYEELQDAGWRVIIVWECELKKKRKSDTLERLVDEIKAVVEIQ